MRDDVEYWVDDVRNMSHIKYANKKFDVVYHLAALARIQPSFKDPMTYDGLDSISEIHPSIKSADIFPKMRSLTDEDLFAIAGHILLQPKVVNEKWGGGKIYY